MRRQMRQMSSLDLLQKCEEIESSVEVASAIFRLDFETRERLFARLRAIIRAIAVEGGSLVECQAMIDAEVNIAFAQTRAQRGFHYGQGHFEG